MKNLLTKLIAKKDTDIFFTMTCSCCQHGRTPCERMKLFGKEIWLCEACYAEYQDTMNYFDQKEKEFEDAKPLF